MTNGFDEFWACYPRRRAKGDARKAWKALKPSPVLLKTILDALAWQRRQPDWLKDNGQFIPYPATWLRAEQWEDEKPVSTVRMHGRGLNTFLIGES